MNALFKSWAETPITTPPIGILPDGTPRLDGDDAGFRTVKTVENGEPMVELVSTDSMVLYPVYALGPKDKICRHYAGGIAGASPRMFMRAAAARALMAAAELIGQMGIKLIVLDAFRSLTTQAALWVYLRDLIAKNLGLDPKGLSIAQEIACGVLADDIGSYVALRSDVLKSKTENFKMNEIVFEELRCYGARFASINYAEAVELLVSFRANAALEIESFNYDVGGAHINGAAADVWLADKNGVPLNMGVPFDSVSKMVHITAFEGDKYDVLERFRDAYKADADVRDYLAGYGVVTVDQINLELVLEIQKYRRTLFGLMAHSGATYYIAECWHFNFVNGACHALLRGLKDIMTGEVVSAWSTPFAHEQVARLLTQPAIEEANASR